MKTITLTLVIFMFAYINAYSQCTTCNNPNPASTNYASKVGTDNIATGANSFAGGITSRASGAQSFAFGSEAIATGSHAVSFGWQTLSSNNYAISIGTSDTASGVGAMVLGTNSRAGGTGSLALGNFVQAMSNYSMVIGTGFQPTKKLRNSNAESLMIGFNSMQPTLSVTTSLDFAHTAKVAIGNVVDEHGMLNPLTKLHLRADEGEIAAMFIEPQVWDDGTAPGGGGIDLGDKGDVVPNANGAYLFLGNESHGIEALNNRGVIFHTQSSYVFNDGAIKYGLNARAGMVLASTDAEGSATWVDPSTFSVWSLNRDNEAFRMSKVGIGTDEPTNALDVNGNISVNDAIIGKVGSSKWVDPDFLTLLGSDNEQASKIMIAKGNNTTHQAIKFINPAQGGEFQFFTGGVFNTIIRHNEFLIGKVDTPMELKVTGKIWAHEVEVKLDDWWDEVFDKDYNLMPLLQLEKFIADNNHLPDMPSEETVLKDGIELGEMNALLLKKVEELTLYVIELKKEVEEVKRQQTTR